MDFTCLLIDCCINGLVTSLWYYFGDSRTFTDCLVERMLDDWECAFWGNMGALQYPGFFCLSCIQTTPSAQPPLPCAPALVYWAITTPKQQGQMTLKWKLWNWAKLTFFSFKVYCLRHLVIIQEADIVLFNKLPLPWDINNSPFLSTETHSHPKYAVKSLWNLCWFWEGQLNPNISSQSSSYFSWWQHVAELMIFFFNKMFLLASTFLWCYNFSVQWTFSLSLNCWFHFCV